MIEAMQEHGKIIIPTLLATTSAIGGLALWWQKRYYQKEDEWKAKQESMQDKIMAKLDKALDAHHECQKQLVERFVGKPDFTLFLQTRAADHAMINSRLHSLETQQANLISKIDLFMDDSTKKVERLSATFIAKEGEISQRIDRLADRMNHKGGS